MNVGQLVSLDVNHPEVEPMTRGAKGRDTPMSKNEADTDASRAPTSQAKIESNRRNAQRSTGPRTQRGKEVSRLNGMTHGACSKIAVLPGEDPEARTRRLEAWLDALGAETEPEIYLV